MLHSFLYKPRGEATKLIFPVTFHSHPHLKWVFIFQARGAPCEATPAGWVCNAAIDVPALSKATEEKLMELHSLPSLRLAADTSA